MNRQIAISLLGGIFFLAGCEGESGSQPSGGEIFLQTRRSALSDDAHGKTAADTVCFAKGEKSYAYSTVWKAEVKGNKTALLERQYYPTDNSAVYLRGYSPVAAISGNRVSYTFDGSQDICVTEQQSGRLNDMFWQESKCFSFAHLLTQLQFRVQCDTKETLQLLSLQVEGSRRQGVVDLETGRITFDGDMQKIKAFEDTLSFGAEYVPVPGVVMVEPGVPLFLSLTVLQPDGRETVYGQLAVSFEETDKLPKAGISYLLSVTLRRGGGISLSPVVSEWKRGANGVGNIEN